MSQAVFLPPHTLNMGRRPWGNSAERQALKAHRLASTVTTRCSNCGHWAHTGPLADGMRQFKQHRRGCR